MGESHQAHWNTGFSHLFWIFNNRFSSPKALAKQPDRLMFKKLFHHPTSHAAVQLIRYGMVVLVAFPIDFGLLYIFADINFTCTTWYPLCWLSPYL